MIVRLAKVQVMCAMFGFVVTALAADPDTFYMRLSDDPATLNVITTADLYGQKIEGYVYDSLLTRDPKNYEWVPTIAEKYEISKDGKLFTFHIREGVKFSDGTPLTVEDIKYSFDVYFEGRFKAPQTQVYYENIRGAEIVDAKTIRFSTKITYFKNFEVVAGLNIIPKGFFGKGDPMDPKFNRQMLGTGPYVLAEWTKGQRIILKRNPYFWGTKVPFWKDRFKVDRLFFRIVKEEAVALELLKKGDVDYVDDLRPEDFVTKTKGPEWGTKVEAVKVENSDAINFEYSFIGWNNTHPIFKDRDVRMAMSMLVNRDLMIKKFRYGMSLPAVGPFGNKNPASSPNVKPVAFNPKKALELLNKKGWKMGPHGLSKVIDGKEVPFEFTLIYSNQETEKYWTVIKEDMGKVGITLNLKLLEWNSFIKLVDEHKFDAITMRWTVALDPDPKQVWHSASIPTPGGNFVSYSNPEVDRLIDQLRSIMDGKKRYDMLHKVHELIAADQPYTFLFNNKFVLFADTLRVKKPFGNTFKFGVDPSTWILK